jgi:hypothetical protein
LPALRSLVTPSRLVQERRKRTEPLDSRRILVPPPLEILLHNRCAVSGLVIHWQVDFFLTRLD